MNTADTIIASKPASPLTTPSSEVHCCPNCGAPAIAEPRLVCGGEVIRLRCFVYRHGNHYRAECIDLDIATEGDIDKEAIAGLQDAMNGYLSVAFDGEDTRGLILRPSPPLHRIHYHVERLKDRFLAIFSKHRGHTRERFYSIPSHNNC
jgi:hypothetical protein